MGRAARHVRRRVGLPAGSGVGRGMALLLLLGGCNPHTVRKQPPPPLEVPEAFSVPAREGAPLARPWWRVLEDDTLEALVREALDDNFDVRVAWARLRQSEALLVQAGAGDWPRLELESRAGIQRQFFTIEDRNLSFINRLYAVSLAASYEVDLWGRLDARQAAAGLDFLAARDDVETAAVTVSARVAEAWYDLISQRALVELLAEQVRISEVLLQVVLLRYQEGLTPARDVALQRTQLARTRAQLEQLQGRRETTEHRLRVLLGRAPTGAAELPAEATLPELPPLPEAGVPADLLLRRPDVRAWMRRVEAADQQVAAAVAERLPQLRLTGEFGFRNTRLEDLFTSPIWSLFAGLLAPLLDGGRLAAQEDQRRAELDEAAARYAGAFLQAMQEVEDALVLERQQRLSLAHAEQALESARLALGEARLSYQEGLGTYLPVLDALRTQQQQAQEVVQARRQLISHRIQLYRALGGDWGRELQPPSPQPEPAP